MIFVGIDVAKNKHDVAVLNDKGKLILKPLTFSNTRAGFNLFINTLSQLKQDYLIALEDTGHYAFNLLDFLHEHGATVYTYNPLLIKEFAKSLSLRKTKTDKKDAVKLANYGLDHWLTLPRYVPEEDTRLLLKTCYRQYQQYSKVQTMLKNNLISLLDAVFPEVNRLFNSSPRADGSEKWVDFVSTFWHCQCVSTLSLKSFSARYLKWCRKHGYYFSQEKAFEIHSKAQSCIGVMPRNETTKLLVQQAIAQLKATSAALAALKQEMQSLAASLPEYPVVMEMFGVGSTLGPQLMAEIGDVRRFHSKKALVAFAGIDAPPCQSGQMDIHSRSISKRGSAALRRTLFLVMGIYLQSAPLDEPVYQFMDKKRSEGKPYKVYMMASANKFLRIYYASVTAYLNTLARI